MDVRRNVPTWPRGRPWSPSAWGRYLLAVLRIGSWPLRLRVARARRPRRPTALPSCPGCPRNCCYSPHVVVLRLEDVARLHAAGLGHAVVPPRRSPFFPLADRTGGSASDERFPTLEKREGRCVFLGDDHRCGIYDHRPSVCRSYPYQVRADGLAVRYANACPSRREGSSAEADAMIDEAIDGSLARFRDLLRFEFGRAEIEALGLAGYFERPPAAPFGAVLAEKQDEREGAG